MDDYFVVKYSGGFGFIKPWTAVRDEEIYSQQFLTPSMVSGIEKKLFPELLEKEWGIYKIVGHRLTYNQIARQQETTQTRGWNSKGQGNNRLFERPKSILTRGVFVNPTLFLAFTEKDDAHIAFSQHICLARNEDILYPETIIETSKLDFESNAEIFSGFELVFEEKKKSFLVGYNRYNNFQKMYGWLRVVGNPVRNVF